MIPYLVCEFGKPAISNLIKECFGSEFPEIFSKPQVDYIYRYLKDLDAGTVLLETQYVDKDYLDDYSKFYVRRFSSKDHKCARLHFFTGTTTHQDFENWLTSGLRDDEHRTLKNSYLGFMIIKPLPRTFIGKTCLRLYPTFDHASRLHLTRTYAVNLFGIALEVHSIAFQEQDKVVAACATTAIWSALNGISSLPIRSIPSCSEITTAAINFVPGSNNRFPSTELSQKQILRALDVAGYRHHSHSLKDASADEVFDLASCYLRSGIPLILGADVFDGKEGTKLGAHASAILGCETATAERALYVHDDRLGPFARASVSKSSDVSEIIGPQAGVLFSLQEKDDSGAWQATRDFIALKSLVAITDKKVRLPLIVAMRTCEFIRKTYRAGAELMVKAGQIKAEHLEQVSSDLTFQIELAEVSQLKAELLREPLITTTTTPEARWSFRDWSTDPGERRAAFLSRPFARFHWVARFKHAGATAFLVLFDATDIPQGDAVSAVYVQDALRFEAFFTVLSKVPSKDHLADWDKDLFASFMRRVANRGGSLAEYLDRAYGSPRAPLRIKSEETRDGNIQANDKLRKYYEAVDRTLEDEFAELIKQADSSIFLIWVIDHEGTLLVGREDGSLGHPTLTGFKPARVGGELRRTGTGWVINSKSGRYSGNYQDANPYLENALKKFKSIFYQSRESITAEPYKGAECCDSNP
jgi:hypothetical protein